MQYETIKVEVDDRGVATLTLNRPQKHNALNAELIREVTAAANKLDDDSGVRAVILTGAGESFCAGGDFKWMQGLFNATREQRVNDSVAIFKMLQALYSVSKPLIGKVNGQAYGGGTGMMAVCDICIASDVGRYALTEVRLGLVPANISKFVVQKMGVANARRTFLNAFPMSASDACRYGLVDVVASPHEIDEVVESEVLKVLQCAPAAVAVTKKMISYVSVNDEESSMEYVSNLLADAWESKEGQEGMTAFFNKARPSWRV